MIKKVVSKSQYRAPDDLFGVAIRYTCIDEEGKMWVGNDEYETQVNYCPMTGEKAPVQMESTDQTVQLADNTVRTYRRYVNK